MLPFGKDQTVAKAIEQIEAFKEKVALARTQIAELGPGLGIFKMEPPDAKLLDQVEEELGLLEAIWGVAQGWDQKWTEWKQGKFRDLDCDFLEKEAAQVFKTVSKLGRSMKKWRCWQMMKDKIDEFRATLPLILNLRNHAMRDRHWERLCSELGKTIEPNSDSFTLEQVFALGLHHHGDFISDLSGIANKELAIEESLQAIDLAWKGINVEIGEYVFVFSLTRQAGRQAECCILPAHWHSSMCWCWRLRGFLCVGHHWTSGVELLLRQPRCRVADTVGPLLLFLLVPLRCLRLFWCFSCSLH
jgi:dynein heavy chain